MEVLSTCWGFVICVSIHGKTYASWKLCKKRPQCVSCSKDTNEHHFHLQGRPQLKERQRMSGNIKLPNLLLVSCGLSQRGTPQNGWLSLGPHSKPPTQMGYQHSRTAETPMSQPSFSRLPTRNPPCLTLTSASRIACLDLIAGRPEFGNSADGSLHVPCWTSKSSDRFDEPVK